MIECQYNIANECQIAGKLAGQSVILTRGACEHCVKQDKPRAENCVTATLACNSWKKKDAERYKELNRRYAYLIDNDITRSVSRSTVMNLDSGVGTGLHKILKERGWEVEPNCPCLQMILKMNKEGSEWCRQNAQIIINSMVNEWQRRFKYAAYIMPKWLLNIKASELVELAIANYEQSKGK